MQSQPTQPNQTTQPPTPTRNEVIGYGLMVVLGLAAGVAINPWISVFALLFVAVFILRQMNQTITGLRNQLVDVSTDLSQLREEKDRLETTIDTMNDMLLVTDTNGAIRWVNQAAARLLGYEKTQLVGRRIEFLEDSTRSTLDFKAIIAQRTAINCDFAFTTSDNQRLPVTLSAAYLPDDAGIVVVAQDATERIKQRDQLRYDSRLLNEVSDAIISTTMDGTILSWNHGAEVIYGWTAEEVTGKQLISVVPTEYDDTVKQQYSIDGYWRGEVLQKRKDGTPVDILTSIALLLDHEGQPTGTVTVNHDISQLKQTERLLEERVREFAQLAELDSKISSTLDMEVLLKTAMESAVEMSAAESGFLLVINDDGSQSIHRYGGYVRTIPPTEFKTYGVTARVMSTMEPEMVLDVSVDPDYVADQADTQALIALPIVAQDRLMGVLELETTNAERFTYQKFEFLKLLTARIATAADNARLYQMSQRQIEEFQTLYAKVSQLEQLKTDMINIASHDLRNPIGISTGYIELLRLDSYSHMQERDIEYIEAIAKSLDRMEKIVNDILSLERITQMAEAPHTNRVDLTEVVRHAVRAFQDDAARRELELDLGPDSWNDPVFVMGDSAQLNEVMSNLLTNAIKYTPSKNGNIIVTLQVDDNAGIIRVKDNGYGIPDEEQARLFEPFFRAYSEETQDIAGLGLGLHLVKNIIERHNGEMVFNSVYGEGSTFGFRIPLAPSDT